MATERFAVNGFEVTFTPWRSEVFSEDFTAVSISRDGREVYHAGMTKMTPSESQAASIVDAAIMLEDALEEKRKKGARHADYRR